MSYFEIDEYIPNIENLKTFLEIDYELPPPTQEQINRLNETDKKLRYLHSIGLGDEDPQIKKALSEYKVGHIFCRWNAMRRRGNISGKRFFIMRNY